jgi:hypothetical protein
MDMGEVRDMEFEPTRGLRYVELFAVGPEWIMVYNSIGLSDGPPELWDALDEEAAAEQLGVDKVVKNGPHWWMADKATISFGIEETTVGGIGFRKVARLPAFVAKTGAVEPPPYNVLQANKTGVNVYRASQLVYELVSPDGKAFVLQSTNVPPDELATLDDRLHPAEGWQFRTRTLDEDWKIAMQGKVKVVADELKNIYNLPPEADDSEAEAEGEDKPLDVVIALYPGPDSAHQDFSALLALIEEGTVQSEGVVLITKDAEGKMQMEEGGQSSRKRLKGFVREHVTKSVAEAMDKKLPAGAAGLIAVYDHPHAADVDKVLENTMSKAVGHMDKASPGELKSGLEQAQSRL